MRHVDRSVRDGGDALALLADQLPRGMSIGRPMIVTEGGTVMTSDGAVTAAFEVDDDGRGASRVARLADGRAEVTRWRYRRETARRIVADDPGGDGSGPDDGPQPYSGPPGGPDDPEFAVSPVHNRAC